SFSQPPSFVYFFFLVTAATLFSPLSLHDALPISLFPASGVTRYRTCCAAPSVAGRVWTFSVTDAVWSCPVVTISSGLSLGDDAVDRKSTRLNSSHVAISYAVFCLKKKKTDSGLVW